MSAASGARFLGRGGVGRGATLPALSPCRRVNRWGRATLEHYLSVYFSADAPAAGVLMVPAYELFRGPQPDPAWCAVVPHFRHLSRRELDLYDPTGRHTFGYAYDTIVT